MDLIADIGATNTRVALLDGHGKITAADQYLNTAYSDLEALLRAFLQRQQMTCAPARTALAIAAPLAGDAVAMTNIGWRFSRSALQQALGTAELQLLNDFEALALALPLLQAADCHRVGEGQSLAGAAMAVLGPGSGLGVAAAITDGDRWLAVGGEGGHVSLPAIGDDEAAVISAVADASGHCAAETLLSGPGLVRIFMALAEQAGREIATPTPADVTAAAGAGDPLAVRSFAVFFSLLGTVAGNLALTVGARGGVFIGGGIVPRVLDLLDNSAFRERFVTKGRYRAYLDAIPTAVITCDTPAFIGLRARLGFRGAAY